MSFKDHQMSLVYRSLDLPNKRAWAFLVNRTRNLPIPATEQTALLRWTWTYRRMEVAKKKQAEKETRKKLWAINHAKPARHPKSKPP